MVDRITTRIEEAYRGGATETEKIAAGKAMYYKYFRVALYRSLYKADVDAILELDGYEDCVMTVEEIEAYAA